MHFFCLGFQLEPESALFYKLGIIGCELGAFVQSIQWIGTIPQKAERAMARVTKVGTES